MTTFNDEFYRDVLEGLAILGGNALQRDVLLALSQHQEPRIAAALNKNQIASKMWLAESLLQSVGPRIPNVLVLGGWVGALGAVLLHDRRFAIDRVVSVDIDPNCAPVAQSLNATNSRAGKFAAHTADMLAIDYAHMAVEWFGGGRADLVINTSCEHLREFDRWYGAVPAGQLLVLQSNDYFACAEHVNCVPDLAALRRQAPMREVLFEGERAMRRYVRFMLIGKK